jgi:hypothetical protein
MNLGRRFVIPESPGCALLRPGGIAAAIGAGRILRAAVERRAEANRFARRAALR